MDLDAALLRLGAMAHARRIHDNEPVPAMAALGRVLASDIVSSLDVPPADNSAMDGYALRAADVSGPDTVLPVSQRIAAGHPGQPLVAGTAARIFTGAAVPEGADTVVMQESCEALDGGRVRVHGPVQSGQWVRPRGEDVQVGQVILQAGTRLSPAALGLLATIGRAHVAVVRRPRVALLSSGDELLMPGEPPRPGAIYNANRYTLRALLEAAGCEVLDLGTMADRLDATREALRGAARQADLVLTSGGVSVGEEDHLRPAAGAEGQVELWQLALKPGKPLAVGSINRPDGSSALLLGLPGNPVSSFVTFLLLVAPVLRGLQGGNVGFPVALSLPAGFDWPRPDRHRREFLRVRVADDGTLALFNNQSSGVLTSAAWADGLVDVAPGQSITRGDRVRYVPLSSLIGA